MSNGYLDWAWDYVVTHSLPKTRAFILVFICDKADKAGEMRWSQDKIAKYTRSDPKTVREEIKELMADSVLSRQRRGKSWLYKVHEMTNGADRTPGVRPGKKTTKKATRRTKTPGVRPGETPGVTPGDRKVVQISHRVSRPRTPGVTPVSYTAEPFLNPSTVPDGTAAPAVADPAKAARDLLWSEGVPILQSLLGVMDGAARNFLGKLLKGAKDDAELVLAKLREAQQRRPLDPAPWLIRACVPFRNAGLALIAEEGMPSTQSDMAATMERLFKQGRIGNA